MRFIRILFIVIVAILLVTIALANRAAVTLNALPSELAQMVPEGIPLSYDVPLYMVIFAAIALGLLIGFVWEYLREHRHRVTARTERSARKKLEREVKGLKRRQPDGNSADEILAIVDSGASR